MPFAERTVEALRREFAVLANQEGANLSELCRRYGISRPTGRLWRERYRREGVAGLVDRSRRPQQSPGRTPAEVEAAVVALRTQHPAWGGRNLAAARARHGRAAPAPSTITAIRQRHGLLAADPEAPRRWQRFEHAAPNDLWQLDFMGHRPLAQGRVHPLTLLDDHSRFALGLVACPNEQQELVQTHLTACFRRCGLPQAILTDNGPPWGTSGAGGLTALEAWLLRLGVELWHGQPYHPQTQGKIERFHGTIAAEVFQAEPPFPDLAAAQRRFDAWRDGYNAARPHQGLAFAVPLDRYTASPRSFPDPLPPIGYGPDDVERTVRDQGAISFAGRAYFVSRGLVGQRVAVRPTTTDGVFAVVSGMRQVATIDRREQQRA